MSNFLWRLSSRFSKILALVFLLGSTSPATAGSQLSPDVYRDDFESGSCLSQTNLRSWLTPAGELELSMVGGGAGLQTVTQLSYGRYVTRLRTDIGGGGVVAFYLMGVDNALRNNPRYWHLHDEVDIELVGSLWREGRLVARNASWINAFHNHTAVILPRRPFDDAGGSVLAMGELASNDDALLDRHVLPDLDRNGDFVGFDFNDGNFYTYTIDYSDQAIIYTISDDAGQVKRSHTLRRQGSAWPQTKMYLALTLWSTRDRRVQDNFTGPYDYGFGRPMRVFIDYASYQPMAGVELAGAAAWDGRMPWSACPMRPSPAPAPATAPAASPAPQAPPARSCTAYNRDGISCERVGYVDGQIGQPWGFWSGRFQCVDGCLKWYSF
jgi:hypothetical protein